MADAEGSDEELLVERRSWPRWVRGLAAFAVVAVIGVAIWQLARRTDDGPTARPAAVARPSGTFTAFPDGPAPTGRPRSCPHTVMCSRLTTEPPALVSAVVEFLPSTTVQRVRTISYVSPAQGRNVVWYRTVLLRSGSARIAVEVRQPARGDMNHEESYLIGAEHAIRLRQVFFDRTVSITLTGASPALTLERLRHLAADARLVSV